MQFKFNVTNKLLFLSNFDAYYMLQTMILPIFLLPILHIFFINFEFESLNNFLSLKYFLQYDSLFQKHILYFYLF